MKKLNISSNVKELFIYKAINIFKNHIKKNNIIEKEGISRAHLIKSVFLFPDDEVKVNEDKWFFYVSTLGD